MYKLKSIILKGVIGAMGIAGVTVCALAFIPGSLDGSKPIEDTNLDGDTEIDTSAFADEVQNGQILQCFCWSYNEIIENLPKIASQGFTAIQTTPIQIAKEGTSGMLAKDYWKTFYSPAGFTVDDSGTSSLGTPAQFREMITQAHSYGIKVIVDVVANHLGNQFTRDSLCERAYYYEWEISGMSAEANSEAKKGENGYVPYTGEVWTTSGGKTTPGGENATSIPVIDTYYYKDTIKFHPYYEATGNDAYSITHGNLGMMDLDTGSNAVQTAVSGYIEDLVGYGVDGFRFDSAKNIETQYDEDKSNFWPVVMKAARVAALRAEKDLFTYGEIDGDLGDNRDLGWYTSNGVGITDSSLGTNITLNDGSGFSSFRKSKRNNYQDYKNNMVVWAESHKDYTSDIGTRDKSEAVINKSYAILAARKDMASLYCARFEDYENSHLGTVACLNGWSYPEIGAVNKFHNFYAKEEADEKCYMDGSYTIVERFIDSYSANNGIVIVGDSGSISVKTSHLADGSYVDKVSGNTFTVGGGKIFGTMGDTGIAVIYSASDTKSPSIKASMNSGIIHTDYLNVTYTFKNADSAVVMVGSDKATATSTTSNINLSGIEEGTTITISITLTGVDGSTLNKTYTYTRYKSLGLLELYFNNSLNWDRVFAYAWNDSSLDSNDNWPGEELTEIVLDKDQNECYTYSFDSDKYNYVVFSNGEGDKTEDIIVTGSYEYTLGDIVEDSYSVQTTEFEEYDDPLKDVITVYYKNDSNWANCYAYTWKTGTLHSNATWPGEKIEAVGREIDGYIAYSVDVDLSIFDMIIFNNGENKNNDKTPDISLDYESTGFTYDGSSYVFKEYDGSVPAIDPDPVVVETNIITVDFKNDLGWANAYVYLWNSENDNVYSEWPGTLMTSLGKDIDNCDAFSFDVDLNLYDMISFTNGEEEPEFTDEFALTSTTKGYTSDGSSYDFIAYGTELPEGTIITIYYQNDKDWSSVNAYMWNSESSASNAEWPGEAITYVGLDADGFKAYSLEVDYTVYDCIIFNGGTGKQTDNLSITITTKGFTSDGSDYTYTAFEGDPDATEVTVYFKNTSGWDTVYAYMWKDGTATNNSWPGVEIAKVGTDGDYDVYSLTVDIITYNRIIFNNGTGGEGYQTSDLIVNVATTGYDASGTKYTYSTE